MFRKHLIKRCLSTSPISNYKVAIVGAGPAGFYTAHHLLHKAKHLPISIDFFDRLPTPFGLSRYGVAPDHPEVKNCEEYMENLFRDFPDQVRFFGNVNVGKALPLAQLESHYNSIVLSYGCTASDNKLRVPGSDHRGVISARQFVNWYNGHPDSKTGVEFKPLLEKVENVTIIGNGNVAIDVARVLLADPKDHWHATDITAEAVDLLSRSHVKKVNIVARRGLLESAFTNKEIRELIEVSQRSNVNFVPLPESVLSPVREKAKSLGRVEKRKFAILDKASTQPKQSSDAEKHWSLEYLLSPKEFVASDSDPALLSRTVFEVNELQEDSLTKTVSVHGTGKEVSIENELVILSIGYKGQELDGFDELDLKFSSQDNHISNREGRILRLDPAAVGKEDDLTFKRGWYVAGWIKNGPKGVIATTMMDSFGTAEKVLEDLSNDIYIETTPRDIAEQLPSDHVSWAGWKKINDYELQQGSRAGKSRSKVQHAHEMVRVAGQ